jgi:GWxTD domain-containing protein
MSTIRLVRALPALALLLLAACAASPPAMRGPEDLTNPFLGPEYSQWLVGPVALLASPEEREAYLAQRDDAAAARFIEGFWQRRDPRPAEPGNPLRALFESRAAEADRRFSEAGYLGRRTDRGTVFVVYGEPADTRFDVGQYVEEPPHEVWVYGDAAATGLDGRRPMASYRFARRGDLTVFYRPLRDRERRPVGMPPG